MLTNGSTETLSGRLLRKYGDICLWFLEALFKLLAVMVDKLLSAVFPCLIIRHRCERNVVPLCFLAHAFFVAPMASLTDLILMLRCWSRLTAASL